MNKGHLILPNKSVSRLGLVAMLAIAFLSTFILPSSAFAYDDRCIPVIYDAGDLTREVFLGEPLVNASDPNYGDYYLNPVSGAQYYEGDFDAVSGWTWDGTKWTTSDPKASLIFPTIDPSYGYAGRVFAPSIVQYTKDARGANTPGYIDNSTDWNLVLHTATYNVKYNFKFTCQDFQINSIRSSSPDIGGSTSPDGSSTSNTGQVGPFRIPGGAAGLSTYSAVPILINYNNNQTQVLRNGFLESDAKPNTICVERDRVANYKGEWFVGSDGVGWLVSPFFHNGLSFITENDIDVNGFYAPYDLLGPKCSPLPVGATAPTPVYIPPVDPPAPPPPIDPTPPTDSGIVFIGGTWQWRNPGIGTKPGYPAPPTNTPPGTPGGDSAPPASCGILTANYSWQAVPGATSYVVYDNGANVGTVTGTSIVRTYTSGQVGSSHLLRVQAVNAFGTSGLSPGVTFVVPYPCLVVTPPTGAIEGKCLASPPNPTINQAVLWDAGNPTGGTGTYTYNWTGDVTGSTRTVNVASGYPTEGTKNGNVVVSSGTQSVTITCGVTVGGIPFNYHLNKPADIVISQGQNATFVIPVVKDTGTAQAVTFTTAPAGLTVTPSLSSANINFTPDTSCTPTTGSCLVDALRITNTASVAPGVYSITVTAQTPDGDLTNNRTTFTLTVLAPFAYHLGAIPDYTVEAGQSLTVPATIILDSGTTQAVTLNSSTSNSGITFSSPSCSPTSSGCTANISIGTNTSVPPGAYSITVTGSPTDGSPANNTTSFLLFVLPKAPPLVAINNAVCGVGAAINLSWTPSPGASGYRVEYTTDSRGINTPDPWSPEADLPSTASSYSHTGIQNSTLYHYRILAKFALGNSGWAYDSETSDPACFDYHLTNSGNVAGAPGQTVSTVINSNWDAGAGTVSFSPASANGGLTVAVSQGGVPVWPSGTTFTFTPGTTYQLDSTQTLRTSSLSVNIGSTAGSGVYNVRVTGQPVTSATTPDFTDFTLTIQPPGVPGCSFIAPVGAVNKNTAFNLSWITTNAPSSCSAASSPSGWTGFKATGGGSDTIAGIAVDTTYVLTCTNGVVTGLPCSIIVPVKPPVPTITSVTRAYGTCVPASPPGLKDTATITWTKVTPATTFEVYDISASGVPTLLSTINSASASCGASSCTYAHTGLDPSSSHSYRVDAISGVQRTSSNVFNYDVQPVCLVPPTANCSVSPTSITAGGSATWQATAGGGNGVYDYYFVDSLGNTRQVLSGSGAVQFLPAITYGTQGTRTGTVQVVSNGMSSPVTNCSNSLSVGATPFNYSLIAPDVTALSPGTASTVVTVNFIAGLAEDVQLSISSGLALPGGTVTYNFTPTSCNPAATSCSSNLSLTIPSGVTPGSYTLTARGFSATTGVIRTDTFLLTISPAATSYHISCGNPLTLEQGQSGVTQIPVTLDPGGGTQNITISGSSTQSGISVGSASCSPNCTANIALGTLTSVPANTYSYTISGSLSDTTPGNNTATCSLTVLPKAPAIVAIYSGLSTECGRPINLTWNNSPGATGYSIEYNTTSATALVWSPLATVGGGITNYSHTGIQPGTAYYYRIKALSAVGNSGYGTANVFTPVCVFEYHLSGCSGFNVTAGGPSVGSSLTVSRDAGIASPVSFSNASANNATVGITPSWPTGTTVSFSPSNCIPSVSDQCPISVSVSTGASTPTGSYTVTITGSPTDASPSNNFVTCPLTINPPTAMSCSSLNATPNPVARNGSFSVSWSTTGTPDSCTASGGATGWSGTKLPTTGGSQTFVSGISSDTTFNMVCSKAGFANSSCPSLTVQVIPSDFSVLSTLSIVGGSCVLREPPGQKDIVRITWGRPSPAQNYVVYDWGVPITGGVVLDSICGPSSCTFDHYVDPGSNHSYYVKANNNTVSKQSLNTVNYTAKDLCPITVVGSCSVSATSIPVGGSVTYSATASGGDGNYFYTLTSPDFSPAKTFGWTGLTSVSFPSQTYSSSGNKSASLTVQSAGLTSIPASCPGVNVGVACNDYALGVANPSVSLRAGQSTTGGNGNTVTLQTITGTPSAATITVTTSNPGITVTKPLGVTCNPTCFLTLDISVGASVPIGTYTVTVQGSADCDSSNNVKTFSVNVIPVSTPNLTVTNVNTTGNFCPGAPMGMNARVTNNGTLSTASLFDTSFVVTLPNGTTENLGLARNSSNLATSAFSDVTAPSQWTQVAGVSMLRVCADRGNGGLGEIAETSEGDNCYDYLLNIPATCNNAYNDFVEWVSEKDNPNSVITAISMYPGETRTVFLKFENGNYASFTTAPPARAQVFRIGEMAGDWGVYFDSVLGLNVWNYNITIDSANSYASTNATSWTGTPLRPASPPPPYNTYYSDLLDRDPIYPYRQYLPVNITLKPTTPIGYRKSPSPSCQGAGATFTCASDYDLEIGGTIDGVDDTLSDNFARLKINVVAEPPISASCDAYFDGVPGKTSTTVMAGGSVNYTHILTTRYCAKNFSYPTGQFSYKKHDAAYSWTTSFSWFPVTCDAGGITTRSFPTNNELATKPPRLVDRTTSGIGSMYWSSVSSSADGVRLVAVDIGWNGTGGYIYTSPDGGVTWNGQYSAPYRSWTSVASSADGAKVVATTRNGYIYTSTDYGVTWTEQINSGIRNWSAVASSADGVNLVAAVDGGFIYTSGDSGFTWTQRAFSASWVSVASSASGMNLSAVQWGGNIYTSTNLGSTWNITSAPVRYWRDIASSADGQRLVANEYICAPGCTGFVWTSTNAGSTWTQRVGAGNLIWKAIASSADGLTIVGLSGNSGLTGSSVISTDGGVTWATTEPTVGNQYWSEVALSTDGTRIVAVANQGPIFTSPPSTYFTRDKWFEVRDDVASPGPVYANPSPICPTLTVNVVDPTPSTVSTATPLCSQVGPGVVNVSWTAVPGATGYKIYRCNHRYDHPQCVKDDPTDYIYQYTVGPVTSYQDRGGVALPGNSTLSAGSDYAYQVKPIFGTTDGPWSTNEVTGTTSSCPVMTATCTATPSNGNPSTIVNWSSTASGGTWKYSFNWSDNFGNTRNVAQNVSASGWPGSFTSITDNFGGLSYPSNAIMTLNVVGSKPADGSNYTPTPVNTTCAFAVCTIGFDLTALPTSLRIRQLEGVPGVPASGNTTITVVPTCPAFISTVRLSVSSITNSSSGALLAPATYSANFVDSTGNPKTDMISGDYATGVRLNIRSANADQLIPPGIYIVRVLGVTVPPSAVSDTVEIPLIVETKAPGFKEF